MLGSGAIGGTEWRGARRLALMGAAAASCLAAASAARAQSTAATEVQEVIVTGSRIPAPALQGISPVVSTGPEEIKRAGNTNLEAVLRDLPVALPGLSSTTNNFGNGYTVANLRDLGPSRTLVLVDGKRVTPVDFHGTVNLDAIPPSLIQRIDVLTGGASAVYGADAVAGVINFILKRDFTGLTADAQYTWDDPGDGAVTNVNLTAGADFADNRGNITVFADYTKRDLIKRRNRDWASPERTSNGQTLVPFSGNVIQEGRLPNLGLMFTADRTLVPYDGRLFDRTTNQYIITPQDRISFGFNGHYDLAPAAELYFRAFGTRSLVNRQTSVVDIETPVTVNFGNPLLSDQERAILFAPGPHAAGDTTTFNIQKAMLALGNNGEHNDYREVDTIIGLRGPLGSHFKYDVSAQYGETKWNQTLVGDASPARFAQGLLVNPDGTCVNPSGGCIPIDIFTGAPGAITPQQVAFFGLVNTAVSTTKQWVLSVDLSGDLGGLGAKSPWADTPVGFALGAEQRHEESAYRPDDVLAVGNNLSFGAIPPTVGAYNVKDLYAELRVPLVDRRPWVDALGLEFGYRASDYSLAGRANTYKVGGYWAPIPDLRFRASFERAVRAPSIGELFAPIQQSIATAVDPCFANGARGPTASAALCTATGVPTANYGNPAFQCPSDVCTSLRGGNPDLKFERSDSVTVGVGFKPSFAPGFSASIDYYDIKIDGAIAPFGASTPVIIANCYGTAAGQNPSQDPNNIYCRQISRTPDGAIFGGGHLGITGGGVLLVDTNSAFLRTKGVDYNLTYDRDLADFGITAVPGSIALTANGTYVDSYTTQQLQGMPVFECAGAYGLTCGQPLPRWRLNARATWSPSRDGSVSLRWRYLSSVILDADRFAGRVTDPPDHKIPSFSYLDLTASWTLLGKVTIRGGINNLFDTQPPILSRTVAVGNIQGLSNTFPATYDLGRQFFVGATVSF